MSYIKDNLMPNETILYSARVHAAVFLRPVITFLVTLVIFIYALNMPGMTSIIRAGPSPLNPLESSQANPIGLSLLCISVIFFLSAIIAGLQALIILLTTEFALTNRRVIAKMGFLRRHTLEILLTKIESIDVRQDITGRLLNYGTVTVTGTGGTREGFKAIVDPNTVRRKMNQIIEQYTQQFGQQPVSNPAAGAN